jgi:hypothetical protein
MNEIVRRPPPQPPDLPEPPNFIERLNEFAADIDFTLRSYDDLKMNYEEEQRYYARGQMSENVFDKITEHWLIPEAEKHYNELQELFRGINIRRPSRKHFVKRIGFHIGRYPNKAHDEAVFGPGLVEDIMAERPSAPALEATFVELRRTQKFLPAFAEILPVLEKQMDVWHRRLLFVEDWKRGRIKAINDAMLRLHEQNLLPLRQRDNAKEMLYKLRLKIIDAQRWEAKSVDQRNARLVESRGYPDKLSRRDAVLTCRRHAIWGAEGMTHKQIVDELAETFDW